MASGTQRTGARAISIEHLRQPSVQKLPGYSGISRGTRMHEIVRSFIPFEVRLLRCIIKRIRRW